MLRFALSFIAAAAITLAAEPDWSAVNAETLKHFQTLVRMNTSDPPGDERQAVEYIRRVLDAESIPYKIFTKAPNRPNLIARLKGNGSKRPILMMGHTDTVNVDPAKWKGHGPFSADLAGGYIYGRGTVDDKDNLVACLMTIVLLKRLKIPLDRDVIFLAEAAEEGNSELGAGFIAAEHWSEIDAEYCLAEAGGADRRGGKLLSVTVMTAEKLPARAKLIARGTAGHGSVPLADSAIARLSRALVKLSEWRTPMRLNDTTRTYFERLSSVSPPERAARYKDIFRSEASEQAQEWLRLNEPTHHSMLRTSIGLTMINGGYRMNVLPAEAEAMLDVRTAPGEDLDRFFAELKQKVADERVELVRIAPARPATGASDIKTEMFRVLEDLTRKHFPGAVTLPGMVTGATDMAYLRAKGMQCYGIGPLVDAEDIEIGYSAHSDQERIIEKELYRFVQFHYDAVARMAAR